MKNKVNKPINSQALNKRNEHITHNSLSKLQNQTSNQDSQESLQKLSNKIQSQIETQQTIADLLNGFELLK